MPRTSIRDMSPIISKKKLKDLSQFASDYQSKSAALQSIDYENNQTLNQYQNESYSIVGANSRRDLTP